ncbi:hypothetical protein C8R48DRAFT_675162 [Suillus tomentosus]|nr:hypothetical protein C8R48DRAFT_675162 [Suillus tomentosus]
MHLQLPKICQLKAKKPSSQLTRPRPKKNKMVGTQWTSTEQQDYLETQFSKFLKQQLQDKMPAQLSETENVELAKVVDPYKKQLKNWFNYRTQRKESEFCNPIRTSTLTTSPTAPLTILPTFNFNGCSFPTPGITSSINPPEIPVPHSIATDLLSDDSIVHPTAAAGQLMAVTDVDLITMDTPTAAAPTTSYVHPATMVQGNAIELTTMDTTTTNTPTVQVGVQAKENEHVAIDQDVVRNSEGGNANLAPELPSHQDIVGTIDTLMHIDFLLQFSEYLDLVEISCTQRYFIMGLGKISSSSLQLRVVL